MANTKSTKKEPAAPKAEAKKVDVKKEEAKPIIPKDIDLNQIIVVRNGFQGKLIYQSKKTQEIYKWDGFGDEQDMELKELRNAKSSAKDFFINNWFMFNDEDAWVIDYLGLSKYYKTAISIDHFDDLFTKPAAEVEKIIAGLSEGQKKSVSYRAREMIAAGEIDSNKMISTLEKSLGVELIER